MRTARVCVTKTSSCVCVFGPDEKNEKQNVQWPCPVVIDVFSNAQSHRMSSGDRCSFSSQQGEIRLKKKNALQQTEENAENPSLSTMKVNSDFCGSSLAPAGAKPLKSQAEPQLFSDPGKKREPVFWVWTILVGQPPKTKGEKGSHRTTEEPYWLRLVSLIYGQNEPPGARPSSRLLTSTQSSCFLWMHLTSSRTWQNPEAWSPNFLGLLLSRPSRVLNTL